MIAAQDRVLDRIGQGAASAGWTIRGLRKDGTPFSFTRSDLYADPNDISVAPAIRLADDLSAIQYNPGEVVKIASVDTTSSLEDAYETYAIQKVQVYRGRSLGHAAAAAAELAPGREDRPPQGVPDLPRG